MYDTQGSISFEDFVAAYKECRRNKRRKLTAVQFELNWEAEVYKLYEEVNARTYEIGSSITFVTARPKKREVFAASFRDRVVHHLLCMRLEPLFEEHFIENTYNCRKYKGTMYGVQDMHRQIHKISEGYTKECWIAKFDLKGFFMSIHKPTLWLMLQKFIKEKYKGNDIELVLWLTEKIVMHRPELNCIRKMHSSMWKGLSRNKSLFTNDDDCGLPIGNLTSQMFANFYLTEFDKRVKSNFKGYGRYVDDFFIIDTDKRSIMKFIPEMRKMLEPLHIELHDDKIYIQHYTKGCKFIGGVSKMGRIYVGKRTVDNFESKMREFEKLPITTETAAHFWSSVNSYLGFMIHYSSYAIRRRILEKWMAKWYSHFYICSHHSKISLKKRFRIRNEFIHGLILPDITI